MCAQAAYRGHNDLVRVLCVNGATVDVPDVATGKTALVKAAYAGHAFVVESLLQHGASADLADAHITVSNRSVCPPLPSPGLVGRAPATGARSARGPAAVAR